MRILLLVSSLGAGGAERVAVTLCTAWAARGDEVTLMPTFSGRGECFYDLPSEIHLIYLADLVEERKRSLLRQLLRLLALRKYFSESQPDIIVSFLTNVNIAAIVASVGLNIPVVVSERTDPFIFPVSLLHKLARRLTYPYADALVVQTQAVASKCKVNKWRLRHLCVIPNPVPQSIVETQHLVSKDVNKRLLAIGRFDEGKQFGMLIRIFASLVDQHPDWSLRIIGDGPMRSALQQQLIDLGLSRRVELPGRTDDIGKEFANADVFVMTSKFEGFPNVLLEALAVGLPCVAFDCPSGPREISMDGQVALLVRLNDEKAMTQALDRLMNESDFRGSLGNHARNSVIERFSLGKILMQWDLLFNTLIRP
jgi:GalNAc-alpha-(1->4)-GalNAc-alpha-(1->3)-diNAcBac-PP-undecaprenol alpha-1,4-N-acetyl-D-galactosaminyltransferase